MSARVITPPLIEPVTAQECKDRLRIDIDDEQAVIIEMIVAARQHAENYIEKSIILQTWEQTLSFFPNAIRLLNGPVQAVDSIKYIDDAGVLQTLDPAEYVLYEASNIFTTAFVMPAWGKSWPTARNVPNAVVVNYQAGYNTRKAVPGPIKTAILLIAGHLFENREDSSPLQIHKIPFGAEQLLRSYKVMSV